MIVLGINYGAGYNILSYLPFLVIGGRVKPFPSVGCLAVYKGRKFSTPFFPCCSILI
jgi:hypothetical protein